MSLGPALVDFVKTLVQSSITLRIFAEAAPGTERDIELTQDMWYEIFRSKFVEKKVFFFLSRVNSGLNSSPIKVVIPPLWRQQVISTLRRCGISVTIVSYPVHFRMVEAAQKEDVFGILADCHALIFAVGCRYIPIFSLQVTGQGKISARVYTFDSTALFFDRSSLWTAAFGAMCTSDVIGTNEDESAS